MNGSQSIAVAVSGGIDSLYALYSYKSAGKPIFAVHGIFQDTAETVEHISLLKEICASWSIKLEIGDFRNDFENLVIKPFCAGYHAGVTPNPCVLCNKHIKFGLLKNFALRKGASFYATGHYVNLIPSPYASGCTRLLAPAADSHKNQAYFLSLLPPENFDNLLFPLSGIKKEFIRKYFNELNLTICSASESSDLCFTAADDKNNLFLKNNISGKKGDIFLQKGKNELGKKIGEHIGLENYTVGQRRGLNITWDEPLYVTAILPEINALLVAEKIFARITEFLVSPENFFVPWRLWPRKIFVRTRYRSPLLPVTVQNDNGIFLCQFEEPQPPVAPGQICVFYDNEELILGAGIIISDR